MAAQYYFLGSNVVVASSVSDGTGDPEPATTITVAVVDPTGTAMTVTTPTAGDEGMYTAIVNPSTVSGVYTVTWTVVVSGFTQVSKSTYTVLSTVPVVAPADLATYLGLSSVNLSRAQLLLASAQGLCETVVSPLPAGAESVVLAMAAQAYVSPTGGRPTRMGSLQIEYGTQATSGGVVLTAAAEKALRRYAGGSTGAFSFDLIPSDALTCLPLWDVDPVIVTT